MLYKLRAILISVDSTGLVRANEEFSKLASRRANNAVR